MKIKKNDILLTQDDANKMAKRKLKKTIKIDLPEGIGKFWKVIWINKVYYQAKQRKIDVYFHNTKSNHDEELVPENVCRKKMAISSLADFGIGSVYNAEEKKIVELHFDEVFRIEIKKNIFLAKTIEFPLNENTDFLPDASEIVKVGFNFLKTYGGSHIRKRLILTSPYTILQYFLFYNDRLISKAMCGKLLDGFGLSKIKYRICEDTGGLIGMLRYDVNKLRKREACIVAPYLFLKDHAGIKFIKSLFSHVENNFLQIFKGPKSSYLSFNWQDFNNYSIYVIGKSFYQDSNKYLLTYRICNFRFNDSQPFTVDKIELFPFNSKDSTDDRENHEPEDVDKPGNPTITGVSLNLSASAAKPIPPLNATENTPVQNPFNIQVEVIKRDKQLSAFNVNYITNNDEVNDLTRELENLDKYSNDIIQNIENIIIKVENFEYFEALLKILQEEFLVENPSFKMKRFNYTHDVKSFYAVEISCNLRAIYLVEFGSGIIGVFTSDNLGILENEYVCSLVNEFIAKKNEVESRKVLWTYIKNEFEDNVEKKIEDSFYKKRRIIIYTGIKHVQEEKVNGKNEVEALQIAAKKTANKIYYNRIKKILI